MPMSEAQYLEALEAVNQKVNEQEARGKEIIGQRDTAIAERDAAIAEKDAANAELATVNAGLVAHIAELDAIIEALKGTVPDSVVAKLQEVRDNIDDNFVS